MEPADLAEAEAEQGKDAGAHAAGRLTYEIFSLLEAKFLFGRADAAAPAAAGALFPRAPSSGGKVCVLSIDGGARASDGLLAGAALVRLEAALRRRSGSPAARLADFFDVAAGSGAGGVLAALLFARGPCGRPMYTAEEALGFLLRRAASRGRWPLLLPRRRRGKSSSSAAFGDLTLRDTVRAVLVPCYDLATRAPFLFSRAAAAGSAAHDFRLRDVCAATCAAGAVVEVASVDGATRVRAVGGAAAPRNPTAAAITHVLNNRREFPGAEGIGDLLVMSIGTGEAAAAAGKPEVARIAADGVSDMVDQAVAMAFGQSRTSNYIRIQGTAVGHRGGGGGRVPRACGGETEQQAVWKAEAMLLQKSVESVLFQGRKLAGETNAEKLERLARELTKEHARRKQKLFVGGGCLVGMPQASTGGDDGPPAAAASAAPPPLPPPPPKPKKQQQPTKKPPRAATTSSASSASTAAAPDHRRRRRQHVVSGTR
ncbi:hypothetical protein U9M48_011672 [Paspalum notatum var. saurae]|uniref:PNPLA domain-containing protein n=1 Tax=Paspalum notatum var. saurae TaxID=547442 RepID=A0AAQ3SXI7_PASNO